MDVIYRVNKEKGVVVAKFEADWENLIARVLCKYSVTVSYWDIAGEICKLYPVRVGVAKTHTTDTFNETEGKKIARKKLVERFKRCEALALRTLLKRERNKVEHKHKALEKRLLKLYGC